MVIDTTFHKHDFTQTYMDWKNLVPNWTLYLWLVFEDTAGKYLCESFNFTKLSKLFN